MAGAAYRSVSGTRPQAPPPLALGPPRRPPVRFAVARLSRALALGGLDAPHHAHELPEQPARQRDAEQASRGGGDRRGYDERQRGDEDLKGEKRLEGQHGPV